MTAKRTRWVSAVILSSRSRRRRQRAAAARELLAAGCDPIAERKGERKAAALEAAKALTFGDAAGRYIAAHRAGWRNAKHADQWRATLATYAFPIFGNLPVGSIDTALVTKALDPVWSTKPETASRLRGRIEAVLDWATARGYRIGENPARWRGHLDKLLPSAKQGPKGSPSPALPYHDLPAFMATLRGQDGIAARALEFAILTAARTGEVIGATWDEIDLAERHWTVPAERMKAGPHIVSLYRRPRSRSSKRCSSSLATASRRARFPRRKDGKPLSNMSLLMVLRRMGRGDLTAHGFRSTFRDWCAEQTSFPGEVAEMALAHAVGDKVEAAYRRGDMFDKRRQVMNEWARFGA